MIKSDLNGVIYFQNLSDRPDSPLSRLDRMLLETQTTNYYFDLINSKVQLEDPEYKKQNLTLQGTYIYDRLYNLPAMSISLIILDFREIELTNSNFTYGSKWLLQIIMNDNITFNNTFENYVSQTKAQVKLPPLFTQTKTVKNAEHIFSVLSQSETLTMRIKIQLLDLSLYSMLYQFADSIRFKQVLTRRSQYDTNKQFGFIVSKTSSKSLPQNLATSDSSDMPLYFMGYLFNTSYNLNFSQPANTFTTDTMFEKR